MQQTSTIRCSNCGQPVQARIVSFLDAQQEPGLKAQLINQNLNRFPCGACGAVNTVATPLLYHDSAKELLIAFVPMELNVSKDQIERSIGDLMKLLPKENFKGYMFNPKRTLTMQGLIEMVLNADGITPEMINDAKARTQLVQQFVEASDEELEKLIAQHDATIDEKFVQTFSSLAQRLVQSGRPDMAQAVLATQQVVLQKTAFGQQLLAQREAQQAMVEVVADELETLGEDAGREDFLEIAIRYASEDEMKVQALVGLVRPVMDDEFMALLDARIAAADEADRPALESLKTRLNELMVIIDQQSQLQMNAALQFLQALMTSSNLDEMLQANADMIDNTFLAVLTANAQEAQRRGDAQVAARLNQIYTRVMGMLQQTMPPEVQFINQLLTAEEGAVDGLLREGLTAFGPALVEVLGAAAEALEGQGRADLSAKLRELRARAEGVSGM
jgi:hypothetical protein